MQAWQEFKQLVAWLLQWGVAAVGIVLFVAVLYIPVHFIIKYW